MKKIRWKYILKLVLSLAIFFLGLVTVFFFFLVKASKVL